MLKKSVWYDDATYLSEISQIIPAFYPRNESVCQNLWQGHKAQLTGLGAFRFKALKQVLNEINVGQTDAEFVQKVLKTFNLWKAEMKNEWIMSSPWIGSIQKVNHRKVTSWLMLKFSWGFCLLKLGKQMKEHGYILNTLWNRSRPCYIKETQLK